MSYIGRNIKKIRAVRKLSQAAFADLFNLARPSVGAYEEGRSEPKIDTIITIANHFGLSTDALLRKELTVNELYTLDILKGAFDPTQMPPALGKSLKSGNKGEERVYPLHADPRIPLIEKDKGLEYIVNLNNRDFIGSLKKIALPSEGKGTSRAFVHGGEEMFFNERGLRDGDILLGKRIEDMTRKLKAGMVVLVVTPKGFITRRIGLNEEKGIKLKADNTAYEEVYVTREELLEVWEITGVWSKVPAPPSMIENRLMKVENMLDAINKRISSIETKSS